MHGASRERFAALWARLGAHGQTKRYYYDLVDRYSESHRSYHILEHISDCLREFSFRPVRDMARDPDAVEYALWYHDAVYDPKSKDNEERSADLAIKVALEAGLSERFCDVVRMLIMATKHDKVPTDPDAMLIVDIDLAILAKHKERFDAYERQIRKEYEWVPENDFITGRSKVLMMFLERKPLFLTPVMRVMHEIQARHNLRCSLEQLNRYV